MLTRLITGRQLVRSGPQMVRLCAPLAQCTPLRFYFKDNVLMPREQGEYYADPMECAERVVRLLSLHDACHDPSEVVLGATFESLGFNSLDLAEVLIGVEREFDLEIDEDECEAMRTVNDLVEFLARHPSTK